MLVKASPDVTIDNQMYNIQTIPAEDSQIVQERTQEVLKGIQLDKLVEGLDQCATFIYMAYLGTAGYSKIQSELLILHDSFGKTCAETDIQLTNFSQQSANVQRNIKFAASCLLIKKVEPACKMLLQCSGIADDLSKRASSLAAGYQILNEQGLKILIATSEQKDLDEVERLELEKLKKDLEIQKQQNEDFREILHQQTNFIKAQYKKTAAEASEARGRAFGLALTSTILGGVSAGISAGVSTFLPHAGLRLHQASSSHIIDINTSSADIIRKTHETEKLIKEVEKKMEKKREDLNKSEEEVQREEINLENAKEEHKKLLSNSSSVVKEVLTTAEEKVNLFLKKLTDVTHKKDQVLETFNKLKEELESILTDYQKLKTTLESLRDSTSKMSDNYEQLASNLTKEKQEYFDMLLQSQKEESKNLSNLRKVALRIEATQNDEWDVKSSIDSLYISIGALKKVEVILVQIKEFWDRMSNLCKKLADPQLIDQLKVIELFDDKDYFSFLEDLKPEIIKIFAGWKAVEVISKKYAYETSQVRSKVLYDFQANLTTEKARAKASAMAKRLISYVNFEIGENERDQLQTQAEIAALKG